MSRPSLSIVVGAASGEAAPDACVSALAGQLDEDVEVIVVSHLPFAAPEAGVRCITRPGDLVPEQWAHGLRESKGELVALLTSTAPPSGDWVRRTRSAHDNGHAVVGGPIEPAARLSAVDWAVYFCRYAPYMAPVAADATLEVPGDNASYDGDVLRRYSAMFEDGFWEPFVHAAMRADGHRFAFCPERVVRHTGGARGRLFARQRFAHGRAHGAARSKDVSRTKVLAGVCTTPFVAPLMTARVARTLVAKRRCRARFALVSPLVLWFYSWWAAGELVGRLQSLRAGGST